MKRVIILSFFLVALVTDRTSAQGAGLFTAVQPNEITPGLFIQTPHFDGRFALQWSALAFPIVLRDSYNKDQSNVSILGLYGISTSVIALMIVGSHGMSDSTVSTARKVISTFFVLPMILQGIQIDYALFAIDSNQVSGFRASVFTGWQSGYFDRQDNVWFRFSPLVGMDITYVFRGSEKNGLHNAFSSPILGVQFGIKKDWDFPVSLTKSNNVKVFLIAKLGLY